MDRYSEIQGLVISRQTTVSEEGSSRGTGSLSARCHVVSQTLGANGLVPGPSAMVTFSSPSTEMSASSPPEMGGVKTIATNPSFHRVHEQSSLVVVAQQIQPGGGPEPPKSQGPNDRCILVGLGGTFGGSLDPGNLVSSGLLTQHKLVGTKGDLESFLQKGPAVHA